MKTKILPATLALIISSTMAFAQEGKTKLDKKESDSTNSLHVATETQKDSVYYTCSVHPDVKMNKSGKCSKCGMVLERKTMKMTVKKNEKKKAMKMYSCSTHSDVISDKPGKCSKCGMDLIEKK